MQCLEVLCCIDFVVLLNFNAEFKEKILVSALYVGKRFGLSGGYMMLKGMVIICFMHTTDAGVGSQC